MYITPTKVQIIGMTLMCLIQKDSRQVERQIKKLQGNMEILGCHLVLDHDSV
jgi:hypothetical protein